MKLNKSTKKSLTSHLIVAGLILNFGIAYSFAEDLPVNKETEAISEEKKIQLRLAEIAAEARAADREKNGYYVERKSYGTGKETEPPRYVKQANKTWLKDFDSFLDTNWLDLGLEQRFRYEYRDNDFRRGARATERTRQIDDARGSQTLDEPILLRTRAYIGIKNILDPLRAVLEIQDSRTNRGGYIHEFETRDTNDLHILQGYLELNFKETFLGKDPLGNDRPIWVRAGRHAWEAGDRRLIARNEWRNTTNNFYGLRANIGDKKNDWQLELHAVNPVQRVADGDDKTDKSQEFYGAILNYRGWSDVVTFEPSYFLLNQDGNKVTFNAATGLPQTSANRVDREIHTGLLRAYGVIPATQFDFDGAYNKQWGRVQRELSSGQKIEVNHDAHAYNIEIGYNVKHPWKPRVSTFYGMATGDQTHQGNDTTPMERFERLFGFARPWSNDDYIQMENIRTNKVRLEFDPKISFLDNVKVDTGFSWYRLDSATDRWNAGGDVRDATGGSGRDLGKEYDLRVRFPINQYTSLNLGYAYFWGGNFVTSPATFRASNLGTPNRSSESEFFYAELTLLGF
ncbi:MAG: hypothetical protein RJA91_350 [Pseudomonadota bacterium]|jgi:hypothetical protein